MSDDLMDQTRAARDRSAPPRSVRYYYNNTIYSEYQYSEYSHTIKRRQSQTLNVGFPLIFQES